MRIFLFFIFFLFFAYSYPNIINQREFDEFNSLNYIELPIKEQACGLRQVPRRGGRKGVAPLNKGLSRSDWGLRWEGQVTGD